MHVHHQWLLFHPKGAMRLLFQNHLFLNDWLEEFIKTYRTTDGNVKINFVNGEITTDAQENNPYVSLKNASVTLSQNIYTCNGSAQRPDVTVTYNGQVVSPDNYTVEYSDNINSGVGSVKITGNRNQIFKFMFC